jgi:hypothetical protein
MRRRAVFALLIAAFVLGGPSRSQDRCQYAHVVDPCNERVVILLAGDDTESYTVDLSETPAAGHEARGVAMASVLGWAAFHAFVTQGPYLHVVDYQYCGDSENKTVEDIRTIDIVADLSLPPIELAGLYAAQPVLNDGELYYPLYVVGTNPGPPQQPWLLILDQEELLTEMNPQQALVYSGPIGTEEGTGVDVAASGPLAGATKHEVFASVLSGSGYLFRQRYYRITVVDGAGVEMMLDPWNIEYLDYTGVSDRSMGVDFDFTGLWPYGVFQTTRVVTDLLDGQASCFLSKYPTDIQIWGPDDELNNPYVHFVSAATFLDEGWLLGFPEGGCPFSSYDPLECTPGALVREVGVKPLALAISSKTANPIWVYTANESGSVSAVEVTIYQDDGVDTVQPLSLFDMNLGGCPSAIAFRDPVYGPCMSCGANPVPPGPPPEPGPDPFEKFCRLYPDDPFCFIDPKPKGGSS